MTKWRVTDLSKMTGISIQTLHHYDSIDLLKPSLRHANGYRIYLEKDLLRLQQIIALKFFGFKLSQIKAFLPNNKGILQHFTAQAQFLEHKASTLLEISKTLRIVISDAENNESIPWKTIIQLIEVYNMTQSLEHSWVKEIFTPEELKQYAVFEAEIKKNSIKKVQFEKAWANLIAEIKNNISKNPKSDIGIQIGKKCMDLINDLYGKKYAHLRTKKFEKGFSKGKGLDDVGLSSEMVEWLDKAIDTYWRDAIYKILAQIDKIPEANLQKLWNDILDEMYGDNNERKHEIIDVALEDNNISTEAKKWLSNQKIR